MEERRNAPGVAQASRSYVVVAGCTTLVYLLVLKVTLVLGMHYMLAIGVAQAVVVPLAFVSYRHLVFGPGASVRLDFVRFLSVWGLGAIAGALGAPLLVELVKWDPWVAQAALIGVVAVGSFVGHRYISFREEAE